MCKVTFDILYVLSTIGSARESTTNILHCHLVLFHKLIKSLYIQKVHINNIKRYSTWIDRHVIGQLLPFSIGLQIQVQKGYHDFHPLGAALNERKRILNVVHIFR